MAEKGYIASLLNTLDASLKAPLKYAFDYAMDNLSLGAMSPSPKATNFRFYRLDGVSSSVANQEFSLVHGTGQVPINLLPLAPLSNVGTQIIRLQVTRAPDVNRIYLSSPDTSASFSVLLEI